MVAMLRSLDVPSRNVTGFLGGRLNRFGVDGAYYTVSQSDAHSWVEVYVNEDLDGDDELDPGEDRDHDGLLTVGWVAFDPTPSGRGQGGGRTLSRIIAELIDASRLAWEKNVVAYDLDSQVELFAAAWQASRGTPSGISQRGWRNRQAKNPFGFPWFALLIAICLGLWLVLRRIRREKLPKDKRKRRRPGPRLEQAVELLRRLDKALALTGAPRPPCRTPMEHARHLERTLHPAADLVATVVERYNAVRFGGDQFEEGELRHLQGLVRTARRPVRPSPLERTSPSC
jgi:hypothetical protein